jgi:UDP-glucose 4-epimerase
MKVLVTGGAGYIGSVTATALEQAGHTPVIVDSLISAPEAYVRNRIFYRGDIADRALLARIVTEHPDLECTIHMAARVVVAESVAMPYEYYHDNVGKSLELFDQLQRLEKPRVVFSSSAAV